MSLSRRLGPPAALVVLAGAWSCNRPPQTAKAAREELPTVAAARVERADLSRDLTLTGELVPFQEIDVMAKVAGYVQRINVDVGDVVRQGQVLAVLEVPEMRDDIVRASASVSRSRAEFERALKEVDRSEKAYQITHLSYTRLASVFRSQPGLVAQQEVDDAQAKDQMAESQAAAARSALSAAREQIKVGEADQGKAETLMQYGQVIAPFDGVISKRYANNGSMIQAGVASQSQAMPLVRLSQNSRLRLVVDVPESAISAVRNGGGVQVKVPSLAREFVGYVSRTSLRVASSTRTMHTEVDVANATGDLIPGVSAEVTLPVERRSKALTVPLESVVRDGGGAWVWIVSEGGSVERRNVELGLASPTRIEVRDGLREGDIVALAERGQINAGQRVKVKLALAARGKAAD